MKTIHVFATKTNELRTINVEANNWGDLYDALSEGRYSSDQGTPSYDLANASCKVKETRMSFENTSSGRSAELPSSLGREGADFTLFLVPQKIKSGNGFITNADLFNKVTQTDAKLEEVSEKVNYILQRFEEFMSNVDCQPVEVMENYPTMKEAVVSEAELKRQRLQAELAAEAAEYM